MSDQVQEPNNNLTKLAEMSEPQRRNAGKALNQLKELEARMDKTALTINGQKLKSLSNTRPGWAKSLKRTQANQEVIGGSNLGLEARNKKTASLQQALECMTSDLSAARKAVMSTGVQKAQDVSRQTLEDLRAFFKMNENVWLKLNDELSSDFSERAASANEKISRVETDIESIRTSYLANEKEMSTMHMTMKQLKQEHHQEVTNLRATGSEQHQAIENLSEKVKSLEAARSASAGTIKQQSSQIVLLDKKLQDALALGTQYKSDLEAVRQQLHDAESRVTKAFAEAINLQTHLAEVNAELASSKHDKTKMADEKNQYQELAKTRLQTLITTRDQLEQVVQVKDEALQVADSRKVELTEAVAALDNLRDTHSQLVTEHTVLEGENVQLKSNVERQGKKLTGCHGRIAGLESKLVELDDDQTLLENEYDATIARLNQSQNDLAEFLVLTCQQDDEIRRSLDRDLPRSQMLVELDLNYRALQKVHDAMTSEFELLRNDYQSSQSKSEALTSELGAKTTTITNLEQSLDAKDKQLERAKSMSQKYLQQIRTLDSQIIELKQVTNEKTEQLEAAEGRSREQLQQIGNLEKRTNDLTEEISILQIENISEAETSTFVKARLEADLHVATAHASEQNSVISDLRTKLAEAESKTGILQASRTSIMQRMDLLAILLVDSVGPLADFGLLDLDLLQDSYLAACQTGVLLRQANTAPPALWIHGLGQVRQNAASLREQCHSLLAFVHRQPYKLCLGEILTIGDSLNAADGVSCGFALRSILTVIHTLANKSQKHTFSRSMIILHCMHLLLRLASPDSVDALRSIWVRFAPHWHYESRLISALVELTAGIIQGSERCLTGLLSSQGPVMSAELYRLFEDSGNMVVFNATDVAYIHFSAYKLDLDLASGWQIHFVDAPLIGTYSTPPWDVFEHWDAGHLCFPEALKRNVNNSETNQSPVTLLALNDV